MAIWTTGLGLCYKEFLEKCTGWAGFGIEDRVVRYRKAASLSQKSLADAAFYVGNISCGPNHAVPLGRD